MRKNASWWAITIQTMNDERGIVIRRGQNVKWIASQRVLCFVLHFCVFFFLKTFNLHLTAMQNLRACCYVACCYGACIPRAFVTAACSWLVPRKISLKLNNNQHRQSHNQAPPCKTWDIFKSPYFAKSSKKNEHWSILSFPENSEKWLYQLSRAA